MLLYDDYGKVVCMPDNLAGHQNELRSKQTQSDTIQIR